MEIQAQRLTKNTERLVKCITEATNETLTKKENKKKQRWMNEEILQMMKERRKLESIERKTKHSEHS